eukprot:9043265-Karenia_brevis.AAC.1
MPRHSCNMAATWLQEDPEFPTGLHHGLFRATPEAHKMLQKMLSKNREHAPTASIQSCMTAVQVTAAVWRSTHIH